MKYSNSVRNVTWCDSDKAVPLTRVTFFLSKRKNTYFGVIYSSFYSMCNHYLLLKSAEQTFDSPLHILQYNISPFLTIY